MHDICNDLSFVPQTLPCLAYLKLRGTRRQKPSAYLFQDERPPGDGDVGKSSGERCLVSNQQYVHLLRSGGGLRTPRARLHSWFTRKMDREKVPSTTPIYLTLPRRAA